MKYVNNFVSSERQPFPSSLRAFLPSYAVVPLNQSVEGELNCVVKSGDIVKEGQPVAAAQDNSLVLHSPIPGKVCSFEKCTLSNGRIGNACVVKLEGYFTYLGKNQEARNWSSFSSDELLRIFENAGVVNTFGDTVSLAAQIKNSVLKNNRYVVLRMFDEDPSRMTDSFVSENFTAEVLEGLVIVTKAFNADGIIVIHSDKSVFKIDISKELENIPHLLLKADTSKYPCGFVQNLVSLIKKSVKKADEIDFSKVNHKCIFIDSETAFSVYEAVVFNKPVVERFVHFTGNCLKSAAMFRVRIGTPVQYLIDQCGGFKSKCAKIVINGMITGTSVSDFNLPVTKSIKSVAFLPASELEDQRLAPCTRCGKCRNICPEELYPDIIYHHVTEGFSISDEMKETVNLCSSCNLCNSACPSRLSLSQSMLLLKNRLTEGQEQ